MKKMLYAVLAMVAVAGLSLTVYSGTVRNPSVVGNLESPLQSDVTGANQYFRTSPTASVVFSATSLGQYLVKSGPTHLVGITYLGAGTNWTISVYNRGTRITDTGATALYSINSAQITATTPTSVPMPDTYFPLGLTISSPVAALLGGTPVAGALLLYYY